MEIERVIGDRKIKAGFTVQGLVSNCGAQILHSFWGWTYPADDKPLAFGKTLRQPSVEEVFSVLDATKATWLKDLCNKGFTIISDRINDAVLSKWHQEPTERIKTVHFVQYLISRGIGMIVRMPVVANGNYLGSSAITSWMWVKRPELVIDPEAYVYTDDEFLQETQTADNFGVRYKSLKEGVSNFIADEVKMHECVIDDATT